jgi:2-methylcitrate dehydratase PrpD
MAGYLDTISSFVANARHENIPEPARAAGRLILLDTLGGMLAGSTLAESKGYARLAVASSPVRTSTLVGFHDGAAARWAAMVNATAACSFETDEGNRFGGGHPAIHVVPAALARAEELHASGKKLLTAIVVAYEVMSRLAAGATPRWPVHSHGTHGSPGAAIASVIYERPEAARVRRLINLAACMTPATTWQACFDGGTVRNLWPGLSAFLGMLAVELEPLGYAGSNDGPADIFGDILGAGGYDPERVVEGLGEDWRVTRNYFKLHFACAYTHPSLDAVLALLARRPFSAAEVERITIAGPKVATYLSGFTPSNMLAAKFSIPYAVAATVVRRSTGIASFLDEARADPAIAALAERVEVIADRERDPSGFGDRGRYLVTLRLRDGATLSEEAGIARGDAANPVSAEVEVQKFRDLASMRLGPEAVARVENLTLGVERVRDVSELGVALRSE